MLILANSETAVNSYQTVERNNAIFKLAAVRAWNAIYK
jgi:hypothetical protein